LILFHPYSLHTPPNKMSDNKELTFQEVSGHNTKKDLYMVIHDKVYDCTSFVDEHPGGEEVLLDVGGQDATEAFEDVGHSDEAREILDGLLVGNLKRVPGDPAPRSHAQATTNTSSSSGSAGLGVGLYAVVLIGGAIAYGAYQYLNAAAESQ
ncbi:cytochrome b5, partial [Aspergillus bombycis]